MKLFPIKTLIIVLVTGSISYGSTMEKQANYIMCRNQKIIRTIRVSSNQEEDQCKTFYTKFGIDKIIGEAKSLKTCLVFLNNVKTNLENASWKCKDISKAKIYKSQSSKLQKTIKE